ncbi:hypothetical protein M0805_000243 [Coniferiporia weirii]|nr:hypothetical protein M0805_000243 [Coniferiporia weirii]
MPDLSLPSAAALSCVVLFVGTWLARRNRAARAPYPPGPKGLPLVGNIFDMPDSEEWEKARQWGNQYGSLVFLKNLGTPILFVNSFEVALDLFEKRGSNYSSRPTNVMVQLEGWTWLPVLMPYGDEHKKSRHLLHRFFQQSAVSDFHELQTQCTHKLLMRILDCPSDFNAHIRYSIGEMILMVAYGYRVAEKDDAYIKLVETGVQAAAEAQGFFLVNAFPILKYLPEWFPGAIFHKVVKRGRKYSQAMLYEPFEMAKRLIADGTAAPSMTSNLLETNTDDNGHITYDEALIAKSVAVTYAGGTDTTVSALHTFMLAMVLYPEAMRRGQEELDRVIGKDSLPCMEDKLNLPYINAICSEVLRWQAVAPFAVAHTATKDDVYNGYFIPAGTVVLPNVWAMLRNAKEYPEPDKFIPERWLATGEKARPLDASKVVFGFGRRICPGMYFAENTIFIVVASILAVFDIQKALDDKGMPITPNEDYTPNLIRHPKPFECRIMPRSEKAQSLIRQAVDSGK